MKRMQKLLIGTVGALTLALVGVVVAAPPGGGPGGYYGMGGGMGMMGGGPGFMHGAMYGAQGGPMSAQSLDQFKSQLGITAEQQAAWQAFATKASEQFALMQSTHLAQQQGGAAGLPGPQQVDQHLALMGQHLAGMQQVNAAYSDLYGMLTPAQRTIADQQSGFAGCAGMGNGMARGMRR